MRDTLKPPPRKKTTTTEADEGIKARVEFLERLTKHLHERVLKFEPKPPPEPTKICAECEHFRPDCRRPTLEIIDGCAATLSNPDIVTGKRSMTACWKARRLGGECGPDGKLFKAKAQPPTPAPAQPAKKKWWRF